MLIRDYKSEAFSTCDLRVSREFDQLRVRDTAGDDRGRARIFVWRGALGDQIEEGMRDPSWPLSVLDMLPQRNGWAWEIAPRLANETPTWGGLVQQIALAAGLKNSASGNAVATLRLRTYDDRDSNVGELCWWSDNEGRVVPNRAFGGNFLEALLGMLSRALSAGSILAVEQISIVLGKDSTKPVSTLAPTLHSDLGYGYLESAITSVLEPGFDEMGGVLFLPGRRMSELESLAPITLSTLRTKLANEPVLVTGSGDIVIYSGMVGRDGVRAKSNGVPHISPDRPGRSARLCVLMRHRYLRDCPDSLRAG